jgi:integrase
MPAEKFRGRWRYRKWVTLLDGRKVRINGRPSIDTKAAAEAAERAHINRLLSPTANHEQKEVPTLEEFAPLFLEVARAQNKESEVASKEMILRVHLLPAFGSRKLDQVDYAEIQDYSARKSKELSKKTVNNHLTVLRRLLDVARRRSLIERLPDIEWLDAPKPEFDFLEFGEATRLVTAADEGWREMILVGLRTGLRQGELLALRWEDVDLHRRLLLVRRSVTRGVVGTPKSGKGREVPLGNEVVEALRRYRHLKGELVFCADDGRMFRKNECKWPLRRACKRAGIRRVGWHVLRHTFASHLVMRGVPLRVVQELLGHATIEMTMRYAHLSPSVPREAVNLLDGSLGIGWVSAGEQGAK